MTTIVKYKMKLNCSVTVAKIQQSQETDSQMSVTNKMLQTLAKISHHKKLVIPERVCFSANNLT